MKLDIFDLMNKKVDEIEISDDVMLKEPNQHLVYQLLMLQHTRPSRNASAKTRSEVRGGGRKPWKQKGTGRARVGSIRSPLWRGGGVTIGPRFHLISYDMPKRSRKKALCSALSVKKAELIVLEKLPILANPKTSEAKSFLNNLSAQNKKVLVLFDHENEDHLRLSLSLKNLEKCKALHWQHLNIHDLIDAEIIILDKEIFKKIEAWLLTYKIRKGVCSSCQQ